MLAGMGVDLGKCANSPKAHGFAEPVEAPVAVEVGQLGPEELAEARRAEHACRIAEQSPQAGAERAQARAAEAARTAERMREAKRREVARTLGFTLEEFEALKRLAAREAAKAKR
jgi:hypothetical protein